MTLPTVCRTVFTNKTLQKTRRVLRTMVVTVTPMTTSSSPLRQGFRSANHHHCKLQCIAIYIYQAAARGFLVVLALSIHDLFEGLDSLISHQLSAGVSLTTLSFRHRPRSSQAPVLSLVPPPGLRLPQVGHLRLSRPQVGQVRGKGVKEKGLNKIAN